MLTAPMYRFLIFTLIIIAKVLTAVNMFFYSWIQNANLTDAKTPVVNAQTLNRPCGDNPGSFVNSVKAVIVMIITAVAIWFGIQFHTKEAKKMQINAIALYCGLIVKP